MASIARSTASAWSSPDFGDACLISSRWNVSKGSIRASFCRSSSRRVSSSALRAPSRWKASATSARVVSRPALRVEQVEMAVGLEQSLVIVLAVQLNQT